MYSFRNDYSDGGHPAILKALTETANQQTDGYCEDRFCLEAANLIRGYINAQDAAVHFIAGGTLTNLTAISAFLRPHEAVISAESGHIYVHETGSVEATGHKVFPIQSANGKLRPEQIETVVAEHHFEHMVKPRLVYISQPTEMGTLYSKGELSALRTCCDNNNLLLFADGARLGSALTSNSGDTEFSDYAVLCDAFYIGGTKNGAIFGEALVICNNELKADFRYHMKQKGALAAKGRILGIQFKRLFEDELYLNLAAHANMLADRLQRGILDSGFEMLFKSSTNQIFPIFPESVIVELEKYFQFYRWEKLDDEKSVIRLVCSWNTDKKDVDRFLDTLGKL
ncbi:MAG: aminotransferase class I/II-fold pyridoxal phosphate-dependent enzyme [Spirochaetales bacterium]|uniref:Aminotransferase class I/II-fold pyridoxal phosphate-dependent enzyme n=1 Tax=Candidatus Thalassospirochaeta sargassi TaxID=3119039 RepID=A0AAJ1MK15_9SPIO|nr:aminotransferase class I/II-fold pyridoxal phosphate-dependent enzyme [Spirochaetales bacterium]